MLTGGAETVAAKLPAASATVLPNAPPRIETGAPGVNPDSGDRDGRARHEAPALDGDHGRLRAGRRHERRGDPRRSSDTKLHSVVTSLNG